MNDEADEVISTLLDKAADRYDPGADLRSQVDRRTRSQRQHSYAALSVALVVIGAVVVASLAWRGQADAGLDTGAAPAVTRPASRADFNSVDWNTPFVTMHADDFRIQANDESFLGKDPGAALQSDPGTPHQYTTLERIWNENNTEMRLFIYFKSDGKDWWSNEIRTYDGKPGHGNWVIFTGEFFKRPLGQPFIGDFVEAASSGGSTLVMTGLHLEPFIAPAVCANQTTPYVLELLYPDINMSNAPTAGFSVVVRLRDRTCQPVVDASGFTYEYNSADPKIVVAAGFGCIAGEAPAACSSRADLKGVDPGKTMVSVTVRQRSDNAIVAQGTIAVTVQATDPASKQPTSNHDAGTSTSNHGVGTIAPTSSSSSPTPRPRDP